VVRLARIVGLAAVAGLLSAGIARADVKVDVKQDATTKLWRYAYTIQNDDTIKTGGIGEIEEMELTTRDLMGVDVPIMALLGEGWSVSWDKDEDDEPLVFWGSAEDKFDLKVGGPAVTLVLFSTRAPGDATFTLLDGNGNEMEIAVQGPMGE